MSAIEQAAKEAITSNVGFALGSNLMGLIFENLFVGVILCQTVKWIPQAKNDKPTVRILLAIAIFASLVTAVFGWVKYMIDFVYDYGSYLQFLDLGWLGSYALLGVLTTVPVQLLFVERAVRINGNSQVILWISILLSGLTFAGGLGTFICTRGQTLLAVPRSAAILFRAWPTACSVAHLFNTSTIIFGLLSARNKAQSANEASDRLIKRLIRGCLEAQIPGTVFAFLAMVVMCQNNSSMLIPFLLMTHAKVYLMGGLAMVNSRHTWRKEGITPGVTLESSPVSVQTLPTQTMTSQSSSSHWPKTPTSPVSAWGLEVELGFPEDAEKDSAEGEIDEKRSPFKRISLRNRGDQA